MERFISMFFLSFQFHNRSQVRYLFFRFKIWKFGCHFTTKSMTLKSTSKMGCVCFVASTKIQNGDKMSCSRLSIRVTFSIDLDSEEIEKIYSCEGMYFTILYFSRRKLAGIDWPRFIRIKCMFNRRRTFTSCTSIQTVRMSFSLRKFNLKNYIISSQVMFYRGVTTTTMKKSHFIINSNSPLFSCRCLPKPFCLVFVPLRSKHVVVSASLHQQCKRPAIQFNSCS